MSVSEKDISCEFRSKIKRWRNGSSIKCTEGNERKTVISYNKNTPKWELFSMLCRGCPKCEIKSFKLLKLLEESVEL